MLNKTYIHITLYIFTSFCISIMKFVVLIPCGCQPSTSKSSLSILIEIENLQTSIATGTFYAIYIYLYILQIVNYQWPLWDMCGVWNITLDAWCIWNEIDQSRVNRPSLALDECYQGKYLDRINCYLNKLI